MVEISFNEKLIAWLTLVSGLSISTVAVYYSVIGLISIFSGSAVAIMVMGVTLEVSKLIATAWLKQNWNIAPAAIRGYLTIAIIVLMLITSMGIYGFLSRAHFEQAVPIGDVAEKVANIDERIGDLKENIDAAKKTLVQLDSTVDQTIARSTSEQGASRAYNLRKSQLKERSALQADITRLQSEIERLKVEKQPLSKELRKLDSEVGPIKYIANMIYGDDLSDTMLDKAVRAMILLIVFIFDPLAVILLLASQYSFSHFKSVKKSLSEPVSLPVEPPFIPKKYDGLSWHHQYSNFCPDPEIVKESIQSDAEIHTPVYSTKEAKREFKKNNPTETIHSLERKKSLGIIETLPWERA